jgi:hypothetical protein
LPIRQATLDDVPALCELAKRTWADAFGHSVSAEDEAAELEASRSEAYFVPGATDSNPRPPA